MSTPGNLPDRKVAKSWVGRSVTDADGAPLGTCASVYADDSTGVPEWLVVDLAGGVQAVVPIGGTTESGGTVTVRFSAEQVRSAPATAMLGHVDADEEERLYRHYGVAYSASASPTLLPAGAAGAAGGSEPAPARSRSVITAWPPERAEGSGYRLPVILGAGAAGLSAVAVVASRRLWWGRRSPVQRRVRSTGSSVAGLLPSRRRRRRRAPARYAQLAGTRVAPVVAAGSRTGAEVATRGGRLARRAGWEALRAALYVPAAGTVVVQRYGPTASSLASTAGVGAAQAGGQALLGARRAGQAATGGARRAGQAATGGARRAGETAVGSIRQVRTLAGSAVAAPGRLATGAVEAGSTAVGTAFRPVAKTAAGIQDAWRDMMGKLMTGLGFGAGYVLGARAGRERYEQIRSKANELMQRPEVQQASDKIKGKVAEKRQDSATDSTDSGFGAAGTTGSMTTAGTVGTGTGLGSDPLAGSGLGTDPGVAGTARDPEVDLTLGTESGTGSTWQSDRI